MVYHHKRAERQAPVEIDRPINKETALRLFANFLENIETSDEDVMQYELAHADGLIQGWWLCGVIDNVDLRTLRRAIGGGKARNRARRWHRRVLSKVVETIAHWRDKNVF